MSRLQLSQFHDPIQTFSPYPSYGRVTNVLGLLIEGYCPNASVGTIVDVHSLDEKKSTEAEVVGFRDDRALLMALKELQGIGLGSKMIPRQSQASVKIDESMIGRVFDGLLQPLDDGPPIDTDQSFSIYAKPINPLKRGRIDEPLDVGVRAFNGLLTVGKGQRVAIIAGSGVGKSMLLGMMARSTTADINVIALVGERGREVREFLERDLGPEGLARSIVIAATSDTPPLVRVRAAYTATTVAEYFRSKGANVLLMMDSVTRFAMAQREIGLSSGEPPTTKGYPPSVFNNLPKLLERAGNLRSGGSITGIYTVLIEADDINDPIGDSVRSIVDGHVVLSRRIAARGHFPAIDISYSASRVMTEVVSKEHLAIAMKVKELIASYSEAEDLINIGAYAKGSNPAVDEAIQYMPQIKDFLRQPFDQKVGFEESVKAMASIFQQKQAQPRAGRR